MSGIENELHQQKRAAKVLLANFNDLASEDPEVTTHMIEGETDLLEAISKVVEEIDTELTHVEALSLQMDRIKRRSDRKKDKIERLKTAISSALELANLSSHETPLAKITIKKVAPKLVVTNEALIPTNYWKTSDPKLDRKTLTADLKDGTAIEGASLSNGGQTIQCKWS